jgi:putative ABC transport system permease protein
MFSELRYALRTLARSPGFAAVTVLTLGLGIGANTAIFTLVNSLVLQPLPYPEPQQLVALNETSPDMDGMSVAWPNFVDWRERNRSFETLAAFRSENYNLTGLDQPTRVDAQQTSHELFELLGINFAIGRAFTAEDDRPGAAPTTVLSYRFWSSHFGQDPAVVGRSINLHGRLFEVVGVTVPSLDPRAWVADFDLWTPLGLEADGMNARWDHPSIYVVGRLHDGLSIEQASADMDGIARNLQQEYPDTNAGNLVRLRPLQQAFVGDMEMPMKLLLGAVGFVLLIVCANVANLLLARATSRRSESAVRAALGATRGRLVRQLLTESLVLAGAGAALGWFFAGSVVTLLAANLPDGIPAGTEITLDSTTLAFTAGISVIAALVFGIAPALHSSRVNLNDVLREGGRGSGAGRHPLRGALVIGETALAAVLLVGAALMIGSFWNVLAADPGFNPEDLLTVRFSLPDESYGEEGQSNQFVTELLDRVEALPGVVSAGVTNSLLGGAQMPAHPEGYPEPEPGETIYLEWAATTARQLATMEVELMEGRYFTEFDDRGVLIVDETFVERYWPGESAVGKRVKIGGFSSQNYSEIVGVVSHVKMDGVDQESRMEFYVPFRSRPQQSFGLVIRSEVDPQSLADPVRGIVQQLDSQLPIYGVQTMQALVGESTALRRLAASLMLLFGAAALLLAALGTYGVISYDVGQRRREIGLRMALGARRNSVLSLVVNQAMRLTAVGLVIGLCAALALSRWLDAMLFGIAATNVPSYLAVGLLLAATGVFASLLPALRASRIEPMEALRQD